MPEAHIEIVAEDGGLDAFQASPDGPGRWPAVVLLSDRPGLTPACQTLARRLAAHGYAVLAPAWTARPADDRREDAEAWLDHLASDRCADDARVGVVGYGAGADLALRLAAWRAERVAAVAAFMGRGFAPGPALEMAQRMNAVVHLGYAEGILPSAGHAALELALCAAGVDFDAACYPTEAADPPLAEGLWLAILDLFGRTLALRSSGTLAQPPSWVSQQGP